MAMIEIFDVVVVVILDLLPAPRFENRLVMLFATFFLLLYYLL